MRKRIKQVGAILACAMLTFATPMLAQAQEGYTYNYDWWEDVQYSPDAYEVVDVFTAGKLGLDKDFSSPQSLFTYENMVYICDSGNNRIIEIEKSNEDTYKVVRIIDTFKGGSGTNTFNNPTDVAVVDSGNIFIADQGNERIVKLDKDLNFLMEFKKPNDATYDQSIAFLPSKLAVDKAERVYCVAVNINKGLIKFENDGFFSGFVGAAKVNFDWTDYIWKKIATKEQRAKMVNFVPTEYGNAYMDHDGFIFASTINISKDDIRSGVCPIRRLNLMGNDILINNGIEPVIGDLHWGNAAGYEGSSLFVDITAMDNDTYYCLDKTRGRVFGYDDQGNILFVFGGKGNANGYFKQPVSIEHLGHDLLVLDSLDNSITIFTPTVFGNEIFNAIEKFQAGNYPESGAAWKHVMAMNGNYDLAYIGIGRSLYRQKEYKEALDYFKLKWDEDNYSKAFKEYRKEWVEDHIVLLVFILFALLGVPPIVGHVKKVKWEIDTADIFQYGKYDDEMKK